MLITQQQLRRRRGELHVAILLPCLLVHIQLDRQLANGNYLAATNEQATRANGNNHLLLFKLTEASSSSPSQLHHQQPIQQLSSNQLVPNEFVSFDTRLPVQQLRPLASVGQQTHQLIGHETIFLQPAGGFQPQQQQQQPQQVAVAANRQLAPPNGVREQEQPFEEQSISLTIPLSTLRIVDNNSNGPQIGDTFTQVGNQLVRHQQPQQQQHMVEHQLPQMARQQDPNLLLIETPRQQLQYQLVGGQQQQLQPKPIGLASEEQQLRELLSQHQQSLAMSVLPQIAAPPPVPMPQLPLAQATSEPLQQVLWRDATPQLVSQPTPFNQTASYQTNSSSSEAASLLSRLANSSPELLLRLRSLLKRAALQQQQLQLQQQLASLNSQQDLQYVKNQTTLAARLPASSRQELIDGQLQLVSGDLSGVAGAEAASLPNAIQNSSSHEEIKIPLVVIAMPRLLSYKKNQLVQTQQAGFANSTLPTISAPPLIRSGGFPIFGGQSNLTELSNNTQQQQQLYGFSTFNQTPIATTAYNATNNNDSYVFLRGPSHQTQQLQLAPQPTSFPQHTMAPYAQQFVLPHVASAPLNGRQAAFAAATAAQQHQTGDQLVPIYSGHLDLSSPQQQQQTVIHLNQTGPLPARFYSQTNNGGASNIYQQQQHQNDSLSVYSQHEDGVPQVQLIDTQAPNLQVLARARRPLYEQQQQQNERIEQQQLVQYELAAPRQGAQLLPQQPQQQQQPQKIVYLTPIAQRRQSRFMSDEPKHERDSSSRLSIFEESLGRLRPLFQTPALQTYGEEKLGRRQVRPLSPSQMLSLLSRAGEERKMVSPSRNSHSNEELDVAASQQGVLSKKSPKMVFMLV